MDKTVPPPAAQILDLIGKIEAPKGYDTVYGNKQSKLTKQITKMTIAELQQNQPGFTRSFGSSASGRYQFMFETLKGLRSELHLRDGQIFDANLQDRLGYHLLRRRGYDKWINGTMSHDDFMLSLAKEWASFPVPYNVKGHKRNVTKGQSYYAGDGLNKSLVSTATIWLGLRSAYALKTAPLDHETQVAEQTKPYVTPIPINAPEDLTKIPPEYRGFFAALGRIFLALAGEKTQTA